MLDAQLSIQDVSVIFRISHGFSRSLVHAVKDLSLSVGKGKTLAIIGESGSGKTTITNAILGLVPIASGAIRFGDQDLCNAGQRNFRAKHQPGIQVVLQDPMSSFNPRYRLRSSLAMPMRVHGWSDRRARDDRLDALAHRVGMDPQLLEKYPHQLSGGQLQRLSIARAISVSPKLIIADEPASKLDVSVRAQVLNLLKDVIKESSMAMLLITHDLDVARYLCEDVAVMRFGEVLEQGPTRSVFARPQHEYTRSLLQSSAGAP
ncbi:ABC transporter ATP-binding protein [Pollutimonas bauzanensis]|uniref:Peptide/nickel transport system ATP-binding protein n=1 Tax=Pollutimonas bauzanensis TaxID=658167 RepID=A0A1M5XVX6_9BURK|nr:ABC transporter ATP-binding protein [Pollutimonas bauzanensis]SHI03987.1 peptide/nickel transport system ATP-binding protein [Pollutimonas bauzanensis]